MMMCARGMVLGSLLLQLVESSCPTGCLCASDILSCVSQDLEHLPSLMPGSTTTLDLSHNRLVELEESGLSELPRLETLRLAHNRLARLLPGTFRNASQGLRHLDLSSNALRVLEHHYFQDLRALEVLLLFNNRIVRVESKVLSGLSRLRKAYLSHNRLTDFPFFAIKSQSHPSLHVLDLSSNRLARLPLQDLAALPASVQSGLFLHNNTLTCDCDTYRLLRRWELRGFGCIGDYEEQHVCLVYGERRASIRFLRHARFFDNCTLPEQSASGELGASLLAFVGDPLRLDCQTSLAGKHLSYLWVSPSQEYIAPPGNNHTLGVFPNGSLWIPAAQTRDSGLYVCMVLDRLYNETHEVNVTVLPRLSHAEPFNTGFTTLLGCLVSLVLVLLYLYLTPCRCWCRPRPPPCPSPISERAARPVPHAATSSVPKGAGRKPAGSKHVVFLEPIKEVQNGRPRTPLVPALNAINSVFSGSTVST